MIRRSDVILRAGGMMLAAGTSGLRVRELMQSVARTVGIREIRAHVTFTDIVLTVLRRGTFRTQVAEVPAPGVDAHRIAMLHELGRTLPPRASVAEVDMMLDAIDQTPRTYRAWVLVVLVALACASVTVLTNGGLREVGAVLPASALAYGLHRALTRSTGEPPGGRAHVGSGRTGLYVAFTRLLDTALGGPSHRMAAGFVCAAIFLIPGFPLVTAGLDLTRIDLPAGLPRMTYAAMVLLAIAIGAWLVVALSGVSPDPVPSLDGPPVLIWLALLVASFFAVFGWASMFNSPFRVAVASGVVAVIGNVPRLLLLQQGVEAHVATFVGCFLMGLLCALAGRLFSMEKIIMTVPTVLVSIPGSAALRTLIYFDQADVVRAMQNLVETVMVVIAMVAGLSAARMLTDPEWAFTRPEPPGAWRLVGRVFGRGVH